MAKSKKTEPASALRSATKGARSSTRTAEKSSAEKSSAEKSSTRRRSSAATKPVPRHDQVPANKGLAHRLYTGETSYNFIKNRKKWYIVSAAILLICIGSLIFRGLNLGIEFKGGTVFTVPVAVTDAVPNDLGRVVESTGLPELDATSVVTVGENTARVQTRIMSTEEITTVRNALAQHVGASPDQVAYSTVGASWGQQITEKGIQALIVFLVLVGLMIWAYFRDWRMSIAALVALIHDLLLTVGIYSILGFTVSPASLIGVLTILGYSLYDTVVVFDKVRENVKDITKQDHTYSEQANLAINQVLVRSVNTTVIGVLPVAALLIAAVFFMGPGPLEDLGLALFVGMIAGAYSSIFIAAPLLAQLREAEPEMRTHRERLGRRSERHAKGSRTSAARANAEAEASAEAERQVVAINEVGDDPWELDEDEADEGGTAEPARRQPERQTRSKRRK
ncbi:protein translocase subunit SecF [Propionibacteriaceae bacterium G1746]|uniref:protein translocase subunit SecF n=1 Tax=Aestuariimicrobium sp. G57 TaxID=3418485 RepID=UPI003C1425AC